MDEYHGRKRPLSALPRPFPRGIGGSEPLFRCRAEGRRSEEPPRLAAAEGGFAPKESPGESCRCGEVGLPEANRSLPPSEKPHNRLPAFNVEALGEDWKVAGCLFPQAFWTVYRFPRSSSPPPNAQNHQNKRKRSARARQFARRSFQAARSKSGQRTYACSSV
jgi:hypothetical protein